MALTSFLVTLIVLIIAIYFFFLIINNWNNLPLLLLPLIWYVPEQTSPGRLLENLMYLRWFSIILIPILFIILWLKNRLFLIKIRINWSNLVPYIIVFVFITLISAFLNKIPMSETASYLAVYLRYPLFYIIMLNIAIDEKTVTKFLIFFLILLYAQIPEVLYRYFTFGITGDEISWSLGTWGTTNIGIYSIYATSIIVAHGLHNHFRPWHFLGIFLLFIPSILGEIKAATLWIPVFVILITAFYLATIKKGRWGIILVLIVLITFASLSLRWWQGLHGTNIQKILENIYRTIAGEVYGEDKYSVYRLGIMLRVFEELKQNPTQLLFGYGPGSSFVGNFWGRPGLITQIVFNTKDTPNQFASSLLDVGIVGIICYYLILLHFFFLWRNINKIGRDNKLLNIMSTAYPGFLIYYLIVGPLYHPVWRFDASSFIFCFVSAYLYQHLQKDKLEKLNAR
ncbi:MAG: hypothetical protein ACUVTF_04930 [bacterium]